jgi:hypothetical protein
MKWNQRSVGSLRNDGYSRPIGLWIGGWSRRRLSVSAWLSTLLLTSESKSETQHLEVGVGVGFVVAARLSVSARLSLLHLE